MNSPDFHQIRWRLCIAVVLCVLDAWPGVLQAATVSVGLTAGQAGSDCQFASVQAALSALPPGDQAHVIELQDGQYLRPQDSIRVTGRTVLVVTAFAAGSGCRQRVDSARALIAPSDTTLDGGRQIVVDPTASLELQRIEVAAGSNGGALVRDARLILRDSRFRSHRSQQQNSGAAVVVEGGQLLIIDTLFDDNRAGANGGAIFCTRGASHPASVTVTGSSRFLDNQARNGGAIFQLQHCQVTLRNSPLFRRNIATFDGGAMATEAQAAGGSNGNEIILDGDAHFLANEAGRHGGAVQLAAGNAMRATAGSLPVFEDNLGAVAGGALYLAGAGQTIQLGAARFLGNRSFFDGGAIAVRQRQAELVADCRDDEGARDAYCALFEGNRAQPDQAGGIVRGGAVHVDAGAQMRIDGYAFRDSRGPATPNGGSGGVVAAINGGGLHLVNALVFDTGPGMTPTSHLFMVQSGGQLRMDFNTVVDTPAGSVLFIQPGGNAHLVGNIFAGNAAGVVNNGGALAGTCNNVQLGTAPAPLDPGFITTAEGRYRLGGDSPMRDRGLTCNPAALPAGFEAPLLDLVGRRRVLPGEQPMAIDLGAIEFRDQDEGVFRDGFEGNAP